MKNIRKTTNHNNSSSETIKYVNKHRIKLRLSWSQFADYFCIDREYMRLFRVGVRQMHPSFATALEESSGVNSSLWLKNNH